MNPMLLSSNSATTLTLSLIAVALSAILIKSFLALRSLKEFEESQLQRCLHRARRERRRKRMRSGMLAMAGNLGKPQYRGPVWPFHRRKRRMPTDLVR